MFGALSMIHYRSIISNLTFEILGWKFSCACKVCVIKVVQILLPIKGCHNTKTVILTWVGVQSTVILSQFDSQNESKIWPFSPSVGFKWDAWSKHRCLLYMCKVSRCTSFQMIMVVARFPEYIQPCCHLCSQSEGTTQQSAYWPTYLVLVARLEE